MKLLPHQQKPIEHLVARCRKQHGMVLNHVMGSGKTVSGLTFLRNFPNEKKVIILPRGLEASWISDAKKINVDYKDFIFIHQEKLEKFETYTGQIKNSICIWDEAHNITNIIDSIKNGDNPEKRLVSFIDLMYSTKKILLLSGTIYKSPSDLIYLVNIAAGKKNSILPFDVNVYENKYYTKSPFDLFYQKVFKQILNTNPLGIIPKDVIKQLPMQSNNILDFVFTLATNKIYSKLLRGIYKFPVISSNKTIYDLERYKEILIQLSSSLTYNSLYKILYGFLLTHIIKLVFKTVKVYYQEHHAYIRLDVKKLKEDNVHKYISFFNYKYNKEATEDYPTSTEKKITVSYTKQQLILFIKFLGIPENLTYSELVYLTIHNTTREAELFNDPYSIKGQFLNKGRIIGNLYEEPKKFKKILDTYLVSGMEQTVVYSNFEDRGIKIFSRYLQRHNIQHNILDHKVSVDRKIKILEDFKNKKINMLLLHPDFYEGISIVGCRALHILEPVKSPIILDQLKTRVIRYKSHAHLPQEERNVKIYHYVCSLMYDINKLTYSKEYVKQWYTNTSDSNNITKLLDMFKEHITADDITYSRINVISNFKTDFDKAINTLSDLNDGPRIKCSMWTPEGYSGKLSHCDN